MADVLERLAGPSALASGTSTVLTVPTAHTYTVKRLKVVNTDAANSKTFQLFINGSAAANATTPVFSIYPGGFAECDDFEVLAASDTLQVTTSATGLTVSVYGLDQS